jgi:hypothetical protein
MCKQTSKNIIEVVNCFFKGTSSSERLLETQRNLLQM